MGKFGSVNNSVANTKYAEQTLKNNVSIVPETFEQFGLCLEDVGISFITLNHLKIFCELRSKQSGSNIKPFFIKANIYDQQDNIIATDKGGNLDGKFMGYDTIEVNIYENNIQQIAKKIKIYVVPFG